MGTQVCEALEVLHGADPSILHLDLNPNNIRLAEGGRVLTDRNVELMSMCSGGTPVQKGRFVTALRHQDNFFFIASYIDYLAASGMGQRRPSEDLPRSGVQPTFAAWSPLRLRAREEYDCSFSKGEDARWPMGCRSW